jgi:histone-lysine N-methyltransferase SETMAR
MECQVEKNEHFRHLLFYELNRGSKAAEAARNICAFYGEDSIAERTAQKWLARFKQDDFDISDTPRSGRPSDFEEDLLNALIHADPRQTTLRIGQ